MSGQLDAMAFAVSRVLWEFSEGYEDRPEWESVRDCLEILSKEMQSPQRERIQDAITDFDNRLSVKMIGRP
jgi:hypothetical protein